MRLLGKKYRKRWIAGLLLAVYGSAGVFGYGLHAVWGCGHDCHEHSHTGCVVHTHHHEHAHGCHHDHGQHHGPTDSHSDVNHGLLTAAVDDCPICEFLVQAQTPFVMELAADSAGSVTIARSWSDISYDAPLLGLHAARGPPVG